MWDWRGLKVSSGMRVNERDPEDRGVEVGGGREVLSTCGQQPRPTGGIGRVEALTGGKEI